MTIKKNNLVQQTGKLMASTAAEITAPSPATDAYDHGEEMDEDEVRVGGVWSVVSGGEWWRVVACGGVWGRVRLCEPHDLTMTTVVEHLQEDEALMTSTSTATPTQTPGRHSRRLSLHASHSMGGVTPAGAQTSDDDGEPQHGSPVTYSPLYSSL